MALSFNEAIELLPGISSESSLRELISRIDHSAEGSITLLYSGNVGYVGDGIDGRDLSSWEVARGISASSPGVRVVDSSQVAKFLDLYSNTALVECLERIFGEDPTIRGTASNSFLYGSRVDGTRQPDGIWDEVSKRFVREARGEVITLTGGAPGDGVFRLTELPELLNNQSITHIDGIPVEVLRSLDEDQAFAVIRAQSEVRAAELRIAVDDQGMPLLAEQMAVDARQFLADQSHLTVVAPSGITATRPLADFVPVSRLPDHAQGAEKLRQLRSELLAEANLHAVNGRADDLARVLGVLDRLGTAADVIDLALLAHQAATLQQAGDTEAAQRLLTDWAIRNASAFAAGRLASLVAAPLLLAGPWGLVLAAALVLGAGIAGDQAGAQLSSWLQNGTGDWTPDFLRQLQEWFDRPTPPQLGCPLVLDLDGDGVETISWEQSGVFFDHDGNRYAERTGWVAADDALLVRDLDGDGRILSGAELFGNHTVLANGSLAANGFEALRALDDNGNGHIDAADAGWSQLRLWRDGDGDGAVDPGELLDLGSMGVHSLSLSYTNSDEVDGSGNAHRQLGTYTTSTGSGRALRDIWFAINPALSRALDIQPVDAAVADLPNVPGMGVVPSLHQAIARDGSGQLRDLLQRWIAADAAGRNTLLDPLLIHWAGVQSVDPSSYGTAVADGRQVAALEAFLADRYRGGALPDAFGAAQLAQAYDTLRRRVGARLTLQVDLAPLLAAIQVEPGADGRGPALNVDAAVAMLQTHLAAGDPETRARGLAAAINELGREPLTPLIEGALQAALSAPEHLFIPLLTVGVQNAIRLSPERDSLTGSNGNDLLIGNDINNPISGDGGDDILVGGPGLDGLIGGPGHNTFIFGRGDGTDWLYKELLNGQDAVNTLSFRAGIDPQDLTFYQDSDGTLIISISGGTDQVYVEGFRHRVLPSPTQAIQPLGWITFADGTRWSSDELGLRINQGTDAGDYLVGDYRSDTLRGGAGNDMIHGWDGDDFLDGGPGSDLLLGGRGSDTYLIRQGEGNDTIREDSDGQPHRDVIQFASGITPDNVLFSRAHSDLMPNLYVQIDGVHRALTIESFFAGGQPGQPWHGSVEEFRFEDGTVWTDEEIRVRMLIGGADSDVLMGYHGDDTIRGFDGHDRIYGLEGNDRLEGGNGDDRLVGGPGDDWLDGGSGKNIYEFEGSVGRDVIASRPQPLLSDPGQIQIHGSVLAPEAIVLRRVDNNLEIVESGSSTSQALLIQDYFRDNTSANPWNPVQSIVWWGRSIWDLASIDSRVANLYRGGRADDQLTGTADHDFLEGFAGNDTLHGGLGNDRLDGGEGIDTASWAAMATSVTVDLALSGPQNTGTGFDTLVAIENLVSGEGHDLLRGHGGDNRIDGGAGDDVIDGGDGSDVLIGGLGVDTVSFASATSAATVDLANTRAQRTVGSWSDTITGFENLTGSAWNDTLTGSGAANRIEGGAGADLIRGSGGADRLTGGPGADRFIYGSPAEAGLGTTGRDLITDLESIDRIDLSLIDAHSSLKGNQAFVFIGAAAFTAPAQLRYTLLNGEGLLEGNVDSNLGADFQIALAGAPALAAGWLVL